MKETLNGTVTGLSWRIDKSNEGYGWSEVQRNDCERVELCARLKREEGRK